MGGELRAVKGVAAGVALQQRGGLLGRAVLLLDDALDLTIGAQLDAAVAKRIGRGHGHDGAGELAGGDGLRELGDGVGGDERQVAVEHHDGALRDATGLERDLHGVTGAQTLGLLDALDLGGAVGVGAVDEGAHLVGVAADDNHDAAAAGLMVASTIHWTMGLPRILCETLQWFDFMRVPSPAARIIAVASM